MRQVGPTASQKILLLFMGVTVIGLGGFTVWEIKGIIDPTREDTWSELVFDWPTWANLSFGLLSIVVAVFAAWSAVHYVVDRNAAWRGPLTEGDDDELH